MVGGMHARLVDGPKIVDRLHQRLTIREIFHADSLDRSSRDARAMREKILDGDPMFTMLRELRDEGRDGLIDVDLSLFVQAVYEHRRDGFGAAKEVVERIGRSEH